MYYYFYIIAITLLYSLNFVLVADPWKSLSTYELDRIGLKNDLRHDGWITYLNYDKPFLPPISSPSLSNDFNTPHKLNIVCVWDKVTNRTFIGAVQDQYVSTDDSIVGVRIIGNYLSITEHNDIRKDEKELEIAMNKFISNSHSKTMSEMNKPNKNIQIMQLLGEPSLFGTSKKNETNAINLIDNNQYNSLKSPYTYVVTDASNQGNEITLEIKNAQEDTYYVRIDRKLNISKVFYENIELPVLGIDDYKVNGINWRPYSIISLDSSQGEVIAFTTKGGLGEMGSSGHKIYELTYIPSKQIISVHEPVKHKLVIDNTYIGITYDDGANNVRIYRTNSRSNLDENKRKQIREIIEQEINQQKAEKVVIGLDSNNTNLIVRGLKTIENAIKDSEAKIAIETVFPSGWETITVKAQ